MSSSTVFTVQDANRRLPYIRSVVRDVVTLAKTLQQREECLSEVRRLRSHSTGLARHVEELEQMQQTIENHRQQMVDFEQELTDIEVRLVDACSGLVEVRSQMDGHMIWLNWEPEENEFQSWRKDDDVPTTRRPFLATVADQNDAFDHSFQDNH